MANCATMRAGVSVMVHQCLRNALSNHRMQFHRELRTCFNPQIQILSGFRYQNLKWHSRDVFWTNSFPAITYPSIYDTRYAYMSKDSKSEISDDIDPENEKKLTLFQKFKLMYHKYKYVFIPVHIVTSLCWFGCFYYAVVSGISIPDLMETVGAPEYWIQTFKNSGAGDLVATYTLYKLFSPLRYAVSIGCTSISVKKLQKWGWIKPVPKKGDMKKILEEQKGALTDITSTCQDKLKMKKEDLIKKKDAIKEHYAEARDELQRSVIESKKDIKKGVEGFSQEMKQLGASCKKSIKRLIKNEPDCVARPIFDKDKTKTNEKRQTKK